MLLFDPKGLIAADEKHIMIISMMLMLTVVIPVIILTLVFAFRYRSSNSKALYCPEWAHSALIEIICWSVPAIIILTLAIITWVSSHRLDPYRAINLNHKKPIVIQVIALNWKWLFIYPQEQIASVNFVQFPTDTPIKFLITSEDAMNSFLIPQLAGQIYAMAGMQATLHLVADSPGDYAGISANFSGDGFSDMKFIARASSQTDFNQWVAKVKTGFTPKLTYAVYQQLTKPSQRVPVTYFSSVNAGLFESIVMQNMMPIHAKNNLCNKMT